MRTHHCETKNNPNCIAAGISGCVCVNHLWPVVAGGGGMTKEEALDLALEALDIVKIHFTQNRHVNEAITAIEQTLAAQPAVPLTDEQIIDIRRKTTAKTHGEWADTKAFARAIEAAHGITRGQP
jgi:hypothetical protein